MILPSRSFQLFSISVFQHLAFSLQPFFMILSAMILPFCGFWPSAFRGSLCLRPSLRDLLILWGLDPTLKRWAIVTLSLRDMMTARLTQFCTRDLAETWRHRIMGTSAPNLSS
jgi:hypothetical protein